MLCAFVCSRIAVIKGWPTTDELKASVEKDEETPNVGVYLLHLKKEAPDEYEALLQRRARPWGSAPSLPAHQCVDNLCVLLIASVQGEDGDGTLNEKEVKGYMRSSDIG